MIAVNPVLNGMNIRLKFDEACSTWWYASS